MNDLDVQRTNWWGNFSRTWHSLDLMSTDRIRTLCRNCTMRNFYQDSTVTSRVLEKNSQGKREESTWKIAKVKLRHKNSSKARAFDRHVTTSKQTVDKKHDPIICSTFTRSLILHPKEGDKQFRNAGFDNRNSETQTNRFLPCALVIFTVWTGFISCQPPHYPTNKLWAQIAWARSRHPLHHNLQKTKQARRNRANRTPWWAAWWGTPTIGGVT